MLTNDLCGSPYQAGTLSHFDRSERVLQKDRSRGRRGFAFLWYLQAREPDRIVPDSLRTLHMTEDDRLDEVARLLALGYLRLRARRRREKANDPNQLRRFGLDLPPEGSVGDTDAHGHRETA